MAERGLDTFEAKLQDASVDLKTKGAILTEIRDQIEQWCQPPTYNPFLQKFIPIFLDIRRLTGLHIQLPRADMSAAIVRDNSSHAVEHRRRFGHGAVR